MCRVAHQFGLVGGEYDPKPKRLAQLLERLPIARNPGTVLVFVEPKSVAPVMTEVELYRKQQAPRDSKAHSVYAAGDDGMSDASTDVSMGGGSAASSCGTWRSNSQSSAGGAAQGSPLRTGLGCSAASGGSFDDSGSDASCCDGRRDVCMCSGGFCSVAEVPVNKDLWTTPQVVVVPVLGRSNEVPQGGDGCKCIINYDMPRSGREYLRRLSMMGDGAAEPHWLSVVYTLVEESELKSRRCREIVGLLRRARRRVGMASGKELGGAAKASELLSAEQQLDPGEEDEDEDEEEEGDDDDQCDCLSCRGCGLGGATYHAPRPTLATVPRQAPAVEVVRVPVDAMEDADMAKQLMAPRLKDHVCTVICCHCLFVHNPWDGWEHLFALPAGMGSVRVVFALADAKTCSWHEYPDHGSLNSGVAWMDILDVDSMDRSDRLLERLVEQETAFLGGRSERVFLFGASQGGGQSMLRFLRSRQTLGGWIGAVCHAPTTPHVPRDRDPLQDAWRPPTANRHRPMRLLAGEDDSVFAPGLIQRDVQRLREVGGFTDVMLEVKPGLSHEGFLSNKKEQRGAVRAAATPKRGKAAVSAPAVDPAVRRAQEAVPELLFLRQHLPAMLASQSSR